MRTDDSFVTTYTESTTPGARLLIATLGIGLLAALGTALVALGLTDLLAYDAGYRPSHWIVTSYATALAVMAAGWALLAGAALWLVRIAASVR